MKSSFSFLEKFSHHEQFYHRKLKGLFKGRLSKLGKLGKLTGHTIGPNSLLKVMAGDVLSAKADYYYPGPVTNNNNSQITDIVTGLIQAITGSPAVNPIVHGNTTNISSDLNASVPFQSIAGPDKSGSGNIPRAYLNIMFFNERFEFVEEGSTALRVSQPGDGAAPLVLSNIKAPKNGYVYIYLSNENDDAVYFDNFTVSFIRGKIIEENHYYAFGLRIAGISSRKFDGGMEGSLKNEFLYNDKELWDDADLNWYDYGFRNYDAQIARFTQLDPLTWDYPELTNYQYASDEPIANVDMDGLEKLPVVKSFSYGYEVGSNLVWPAAKGVVTKTAEKTAEKVGEAIIKQAFKYGIENSVRLFLGAALKASSLTVGLVVMGDLDAPEQHREFPNGYYEKKLEGLRKQLEENSQGRLPEYPNNGNKKENWDPHDVYEFSFTPHDKKTPIIKYGIYDVIKNPNRAIRQKPGFVTEFGTTVKLRVLKRLPTRDAALREEKRLVEVHRGIWKERPRAQRRP